LPHSETVIAAAPAIELVPQDRSRTPGRNALFSILLSLAVIGVALYESGGIDVHRLRQMVPVSPAFWLTFLVFYFATPASEWLIFHRLWRIPASGFVALARKKHPGSKLSLDALCTRYGIDRSHRVKHGALLDAELLAQVYVELTGGRQIGLGLVESESVTIETSVVHFNSPAAAAHPPRPHAATPEELERHREFIAGIEKAIWTR
jgi:DNA polymerase III epsilon subunit-like protein